MLLVTHDMEECFRLADYVCLMDRGKFLQNGPREAVLSEPTSVDAARFLGLYNLIPAEILSLDPGRNTSRIRLLDQELSATYFRGHLIGDRGLACIRQSEVTVTAIPERGRNELMLDVLEAHDDPAGIRIQLHGGVSALVPVAQYEQLRGESRLAVQFPAQLISFLVE
jgi:ABC-type sulfate/molybdate transport systems ATPase subunit